MLRPSFSIYDASAGSGKTYALVKEYLKIILTAKTTMPIATFSRLHLPIKQSTK
jgi:ATP-dependent exoDNAse (exonuclease V) beta subunit